MGQTETSRCGTGFCGVEGVRISEWGAFLDSDLSGNQKGKKAYIMNMYTASEYRRQGIAFHTLDLLVNDARKQGVSQIALEATDMGRPLYEKYGFVKMEDEMELV